MVALLVHKVKQVRQVRKASQDKQALQELKGHKVRQEPTVLLVRKVFPEKQDLRVRKVCKVPPGQQARLVLMVSLVHKEHLA